MEQIIKGNLVDIYQRRVYPAAVTVVDGKIVDIVEVAASDLPLDAKFISVGFVDAHCHIESSMLTPTEYSRVAVPGGVVAIVSDPHEIANVCGVDGIEFMVSEAAKCKMKICYTLPSCVPAVDFEVAGAVIDAKLTKELMPSSNFYALSEMMNLPGVIYNDPEVIAKLDAAKSCGKPIDGHAPSATGEALKTYVAAGISTDHEAVDLAEAEEKIIEGMKIIIREGSSAKSLNTLMPLIAKYPHMLMFCADDIKGGDIIEHHIAESVARCIAAGYDLFDTIKIASTNAIDHYNLPVGKLQIGDAADFILLDNLTTFKVDAVYIDGEIFVQPQFTPTDRVINNFEALHITPQQLVVAHPEHAIGVNPDSLYTNHLKSSEVTTDLIDIVCYNRYHANRQPAVAKVHGFGLTRGAFGSTIGHDSHNITAVGCDAESITKVINAIVDMKGGIVVFDGEELYSLPLEVGGIMSAQSFDYVTEHYHQIETRIKALGCRLYSPIMTLAFMSLPVIPSLKITSSGLFDVDAFKPI